ncbi:MAG: PspA/IM30 family protein [Spirochaetaceae bacterium]|jgi:phage shock protein A|nr:PspA/IM30 family protein [Spirochaetaceae bacterium]
MGIFSRLRTVIAANVNALISKAEKPEKMLNQALYDMNEQLIESKRAVAMAIADEKKLERDMNSQKAQSDEWQQRAVIAVNKGKDDLAKEALLRKQEFDNYYQEYAKQWEAQKESVERLKNSLRELQQKIEEAQRKKNLLIARAKRAEAEQKIQDTMSGISDDSSSFNTFDRMSQKVDELEARADASRELSSFTADESLEKKFAELEKSDTNADALLADLKSKIAALPDKSAEQPQNG